MTSCEQCYHNWPFLLISVESIPIERQVLVKSLKLLVASLIIVMCSCWVKFGIQVLIPYMSLQLNKRDRISLFVMVSREVTTSFVGPSVSCKLKS